MRLWHEQVAVPSREKRKMVGWIVLGREKDMEARWRIGKEEGEGEGPAGPGRGWCGRSAGVARQPSRQCWCDRGGGRCVRVCELRQCRSAALARSLAPVRSLPAPLSRERCVGLVMWLRCPRLRGSRALCEALERQRVQNDRLASSGKMETQSHECVPAHLPGGLE